MDASARLDRIAVGLRSGLIVLFNLTYDGDGRGGFNDTIVNVEEVELGVSVKIIIHSIFSFTQAPS